MLLSCVRRVKTKRHVRRAAEPAWQTREAASATGSAGPLPAAGQERWDQGSRRPARLVVAGTDWDPGRTAADQNRNDSAARPPLFCPPGRNCPPLSRHRRRSNGYLRHRCHLCHWHGSWTSGGWGLPCCCTWSSPTGWDWCRWWSAFWRGCARAWSSRSVPTWSKWSRRICYAGRESSDSLDSRQNNRSGELRHRESSVQNFPTVGTQVIMHVQTDCLYGDCKTKDLWAIRYHIYVCTPTYRKQVNTFMDSWTTVFDVHNNYMQSSLFNCKWGKMYNSKNKKNDNKTSRLDILLG